MSDTPRKKLSPYLRQSFVHRVLDEYAEARGAPGLSVANVTLDRCPCCRTETAPGGRLEFVASVPLCRDCGDAALAYLSQGSQRPGADAPSAQLGRRLARYIGRAVRRYQRHVARAVAAATRHDVDGKEPLDS